MAQSYSKCCDISYQPLLVSLLWSPTISDTFEMDEFRQLHDQDEILAQNYIFIPGAQCNDIALESS